MSNPSPTHSQDPQLLLPLSLCNHRTTKTTDISLYIDPNPSSVPTLSERNIGITVENHYKDKRDVNKTEHHRINPFDQKSNSPTR